MPTRTTLFVLAVGAAALLHAQGTAVPIAVTTDGGEFDVQCPVTNLSLDITALTDVTTEFPYETTSSFTTPGIGYIATYGISTATITFTFGGAVDLDRMYVWNAYFTIEQDHSINGVELVFRDGMGATLATRNVTVPIADLGVNTGHEVTFETVAGVAEVDVHVLTLHGGNDISLRRIAFAGGTSTGLTDLAAGRVMLHPNPAHDQAVLSGVDVLAADLYDGMGRRVPMSLERDGARAVLRFPGLPAGAYTVHLRTPEGRLAKRLVVQ